MGYRNLHDSICKEVHLLCSDALQGAQTSGLYTGIKGQTPEEIRQDLHKAALHATEIIAEHVVGSCSIFSTLVCATSSANTKEARIINLAASITTKLGTELASFLKYYTADSAVFIGTLATYLASTIVQNAAIQSAAVCYSLELARKRAA